MQEKELFESKPKRKRPRFGRRYTPPKRDTIPIGTYVAAFGKDKPKEPEPVCLPGTNIIIHKGNV